MVAIEVDDRENRWAGRWAKRRCRYRLANKPRRQKASTSAESPVAISEHYRCPVGGHQVELSVAIHVRHGYRVWKRSWSGERCKRPVAISQQDRLTRNEIGDAVTIEIPTRGYDAVLRRIKILGWRW